MGNKLRDEIKQTKPFDGLEQEVLLNLQRTAAHFMHLFQRQLKGHDITAPQYNVLRILRGAGEEGLRCAEIGERMVARDPDITRLMERLERHRLIERRRDARDRRVIYSRISAIGLKLLKELDPEVRAASSALLSHMSREKLGLLIDLLEAAREGSEGSLGG